MTSVNLITTDHPSEANLFCDKMKLTSSASEQNVYFTYVCLIEEIKPNAKSDPNSAQNRLSLHMVDSDAEVNLHNTDEHIRVERSKALHELVDSHRKQEVQFEAGPTQIFDNSNTGVAAVTFPIPSDEDSDPEKDDGYSGVNPNKLKLTKMKWLTEGKEDAPDSSSPSISPVSSASTCSKESCTTVEKQMSLSDKYLSTIIRLDKEHNMFGLSNIAIVGSKASKRTRKEDEKPVFHQTAIVQVCCGQNCCRHKSHTDLPASLKCGGCRGYCADPYCLSCAPCTPPPCPTPCKESPCNPLCVSCPQGKCSCKGCSPLKCMVDDSSSFGLKVMVNKKPKYEPAPPELTPRSSSVLQKPMAARSCHHMPHCVPPSSCFPYLMPCYWPARPGAPCSNPMRCFHNPPCRAPRVPRAKNTEVCPPKCDKPPDKCKIPTCSGNNPELKKELEKRFPKK